MYGISPCKPFPFWVTTMAANLLLCFYWSGKTLIEIHSFVTNVVFTKKGMSFSIRGSKIPCVVLHVYRKYIQQNSIFDNKYKLHCHRRHLILLLWCGLSQNSQKARVQIWENIYRNIFYIAAPFVLPQNFPIVPSSYIKVVLHRLYTFTHNNILMRCCIFFQNTAICIQLILLSNHIL